MKFKLSNNVAFETKDRKGAEEFYEKVMGMTVTKRETGYTEFANDNIKFYVVDQDKCPGLMLDFVVDDQEAAIAYLKQKGCQVLEWKGTGQDCFMRDPYGLVFNLGPKN